MTMLTLAHAFLLAIGPGGPVHGPLAPQELGRAERSARALELLRERLHAWPPEQRARAERRLDEFERLPPRVRAKLLARALALRERERAVGHDMSSELRRRLGELDPERARELWLSHLKERLRQDGRALRERLPEELRRRLERAPPEARRRFFEMLLEEREPVSRRALERMRAHRGLSEHELERLRRLPLGERLHAMLRLRGSAPAGAGG